MAILDANYWKLKVSIATSMVSVTILYSQLNPILESCCEGVPMDTVWCLLIVA
jgi:hypothetical protein